MLLVWEFACDSHRSKPVFMMDATYSGCLVLLNLLLLFKYAPTEIKIFVMKARKPRAENLSL